MFYIKVYLGTVALLLVSFAVTAIGCILHSEIIVHYSGPAVFSSFVLMILQAFAGILYLLVKGKLPE